MKLLIASLFIVMNLNASIFDDINIYKSNKMIQEGKVQESRELLESIENKSDKIYYNIANNYYQEKDYQKAIENYQKIKSKELQFKTLHNLGNSYANIKNIDEAIKSYENALKIKENQDTKFNLELLKKKQQQDQQNKEEKKNKDKQNEQKRNNKTDDSKEDEEFKEDQELKESEQKKDAKEKKENVSNTNDQKREEKLESKEEEELEKKEEQLQASEAKEVDLSHLEEKKWEKVLKNRDVRTLMVPLQKKGENNEQINPW